jgi:hypothetical protein
LKTNVYVDGFNLFYGCLKNSPYRWLDLAKLCQATLVKNQIQQIRYFTALVQSRPGHPRQQQHQQIYIRALETLPNLSVHYGHFLSSKVVMPLATPLPNGTTMVKVIKTEEKGSDVNIATNLLMDGFRGDYEMAVIISNDSDLLGPINVVRKELGLKVGILNPQRVVSWTLKQHSTFYKPISAASLAISQLPPTLTDANGTITKPIGW